MALTKLASGPADTSSISKPKPGYAIRQQYYGWTRLNAEVRKLLGVFNPTYVDYRRRLQMMQDPTVIFSHAVLRAPITKDDFCIESQDSKIAAVTDYAIRKVYLDLALGASRAIPFGYQALEKVWQVSDETINVQDKSTGTSETITMPGLWSFERFKTLDPMRTFLLVDRDKDDWGGVRGVGVDDEPMEIGPERAVLWSFKRAWELGQLTGHAMLDGQYTPWYEKQATNLFCDRYFEKKADGSYKAHCPAEIDGPNGTKIDGFEFMQGALMGLKNGEAITLPGEVDEKGNRLVDVELLQDDKRGDMYHPRIEYLDLQILRAALIADRAGSAGRGSGIGTGEAAVHFDILQMLLEEILKDWFKVVQDQVVNPFVLYNFGEEALKSSRTTIKSKGISNWMRDLYRVLLQQMTQFEVALKDGKVVRFYEYIDAVAIAESLNVPLKPADQIGPLAHKRLDPVIAPKPAGNPGDTNVGGKGGAKPNNGIEKPPPIEGE